MSQTAAKPKHRNHPAHMALFPTMDSVVEAITFIESKVPITSTNEMFGLLMMFHNTLLKELHTGEVVNFPQRITELPST